MTPTAGGGFPQAADEWLLPQPARRVLAVGKGSAPLAGRLIARGSQITFIDQTGSVANRVAGRHPQALCLAAAAEALPFPPCGFDQVVIAQGLHLLAPGLALAEFARVLTPGGRLALSYTTRDDSVPWVRRLAALLQAHDPQLMARHSIESASALDASPYFDQVEHRTFRLWVPITRDGMLEMVSRAPKLASLPEPELGVLLDKVATIYDSSARDPEPLLLPYAVHCWRAVVDHSEFTSQLNLPPDGLQIQL